MTTNRIGSNPVEEPPLPPTFPPEPEPPICPPFPKPVPPFPKSHLIEWKPAGNSLWKYSSSVGFKDTSKINFTHPILSERLRLKSLFEEGVLLAEKYEDPFCKGFDKGQQLGPLFERSFEKCSFGKST